ncbi:signal peptidase I [Enterococcus sp. HY326]|uniref:signal peptidase I n=1 Tax=Enterococcus sp. HY326 TaxID=2971265 RepID=UPI00223EF05B|nr:signal peptidase I [Enterococcus sp. HY326]
MTSKNHYNKLKAETTLHTSRRKRNTKTRKRQRKRTPSQNQLNRLSKEKSVPKRPRLKNKKEKQLRKLKKIVLKLQREAMDLLIVTVGIVLFSILIGSFFFKVATIEDFSMIPTLRDGDMVIVKQTKQIERFDLVYLNLGNKRIVRRVIGLPGEMMKYENDILYIDGYEVVEKFIIDEIDDAALNGGYYTEDFITSDIIGENYIPEQYYIVLGDNRPYGTDSRQWGMINQEEIIGVVQIRILPLNDMKNFTAKMR